MPLDSFAALWYTRGHLPDIANRSLSRMQFTKPDAAPVSLPGKSWLAELTRYHWFVFAVAVIAWMADCMDQQLFNLARRTAVTELVGARPTDPTAIEESINPSHDGQPDRPRSS